MSSAFGFRRTVTTHRAKSGRTYWLITAHDGGKQDLSVQENGKYVTFSNVTFTDVGYFERAF